MNSRKTDDFPGDLYGNPYPKVSTRASITQRSRSVLPRVEASGTRFHVPGGRRKAERVAEPRARPDGLSC